MSSMKKVTVKHPGFASFNRDNVKPAVGHQVHIFISLAVNQPLAVGRNSREKVAFTII